MVTSFVFFLSVLGFLSYQLFSQKRGGLAWESRFLKIRSFFFTLGKGKGGDGLYSTQTKKFVSYRNIEEGCGGIRARG